MAREKLYSGRSGYSSLGNRYTLSPQPPGGGKAPSRGEKTTVRSGAKSSKTYLTTSPSHSGGQAYLESSKTNKKKPKPKAK